MMEFAANVATQADRMTQTDVVRLRRLGFSDPEVLDISLAAAARAFFTKVLDGLGVQRPRAVDATARPWRSPWSDVDTSDRHRGMATALLGWGRRLTPAPPAAVPAEPHAGLPSAAPSRGSAAAPGR